MGAAAVGGAVGGLSALGTIAGYDATRSATNRAADITQQGTAAGISALSDYYGKAAAELQPMVSTGTEASNAIADLMGLNGTDAQNAAYAKFQSDPSYKFQVDQANKALQASSLAKGNIFSGNFMAASNALNQGLASQSFGDYYKRLLGISETGAAASTNLANLYAGQGKGIAGLYTGQSDVLSNLALQKGTNLSNLYSGLGSAVGAGVGAYSGLTSANALSGLSNLFGTGATA